MTIDQKVDATPLFRRELALFGNAHEAWSHLIKHVLDATESCHWGVLIPVLQAALTARQSTALRELARKANPKDVPRELQVIWTTFLDLVVAAVEKGTKLEWYWEEKPKGSGEGPFRVFAPSGILAYLDETVVRTGFLPSKENLPTSLGDENDRRYQLFFVCWKKVRHLYQRAQQEGRFLDSPIVLGALMGKVLDRAAWGKVK